MTKLARDSPSFLGTIINRENIGKTSEELAALWNEAFPGDPVILAAN